MRNKIYRALNKIYAAMMVVSFFAGFVPVIPFIIALFVGGDIGAGIYSFFFKKYYPIVIALGSISVVIGLIAMYVNKKDDMSLKSMSKKE